MTKLDIKDRRILLELDNNSRQSNAEIARKVGLSKQVVGFRIEKLIRNKIISWNYSVINIAKLGFTAHKNFVRLQNINPAKEKEMIEYLQKHPNIIWLASMDGRFDFCFSLWAPDVEHLDKSLKEINKKFGENISERHIATIIQGTYFTRDYLVENVKPEYRKSFFGVVPEKTHLDEIDLKILNNIAIDSRKSSVEIAKSVKISADSVTMRIRKLERAGVVNHYNFVPNETEYPYQHYKILVGLRNITEEKESEISEYCLLDKKIVYMVKAVGPWDLEIDIEVENSEKLREVLMNFKTRFADVIKDYSTLHIYKVHKYNFCPSVQE